MKTAASTLYTVTMLLVWTLIGARAHAALLINELFIDPDGVDDNREYIELFSTTGADPLEGVALIEIESNSLTTRGDVARIVELDHASYDPNGLLTLVDDEPTTNPYGLSGAHVVDLNSTRIEQDSTFLLVAGFDGIVGDTIDADRDGAIDNLLWTEVLDAVGLVTIGDGDADYAGAAPQIVDADRTPDALARLPGALSAMRADAWYGGVIASDPDGGASASLFSQDEGELTENFPAGGQLTPGAPNAPVGAPGDLNGDGSVTATDYATWRDGLGGEFAPGDYDAWRDAYLAGAAAPAATPEPTAALLALVAGGAWLTRRRPSGAR